MISFHNDHLAPRGFCKLLTDFVPRNLHVPVVFFVRGKTGVIGRCTLKDDPYRRRIQLHLHNIFASVHAHRRHIAAILWEKLLKVALHEFGHLATFQFVSRWQAAGYDENDNDYGYIEWLAHTWQQQQFDRLLDFDARLGQPRGCLTGYFGARCARLMRFLAECNKGTAKSDFVKERRLLKSGGQFTGRDVAYALDGCRRHKLIKKMLRSEWGDLGIAYTDGAGRQHKFYTHGDLREAKKRYRCLPPQPITETEARLPF